MKRTLTALAATIFLTTALATQARAGHPSVHHDNNQHQGPGLHDNNLIPGNNKDGHVHVSHRDRLRAQDCRDFRYCCWMPRCHSYIFWCPVDDCWYYWYGPGDCYLPYDQISTTPPVADAIPQIPGGLPPVVPNGDAGPARNVTATTATAQTVPSGPSDGDDLGAP